MTHHLEGVPDPEDLEGAWRREDWDPAEELEAWDPDGGDRLPRPAWWRLVAIVVVVAMVIATPVVYVISLLTR